MSKQSNLLDSDPSILDNNLKFVKNDLEEEFEQIFGAQPTVPRPVESKVVTPSPGMCIKCYKVNTNEKFFINLCQTDGIPSPENISETDLTKILQSDAPSSYRIPMSISEPRNTSDKSGNQADVCDIAVNPKFFKKCEKFLLFRDFLIAIILEALSEKYNVQLKSDNWIILKNRKFMGTLVTHRVQNRDTKTVYESYQNPSKDEKKIIKELSSSSGRQLIQELNTTEASSLKLKPDSVKSIGQNFKPQRIKEEIAMAGSTIPEYRIVGKLKDTEVTELLAELYLPECISANEISLDIGEDRICIESVKRGYLFDKFVEYRINQDEVFANFDLMTKVLQVSMPLLVDG